MWCVMAKTALQSTPMVASTVYDVTWNGLCGSCDDYGFCVIGVGTVTLICCVCICPGDGV